MVIAAIDAEARRREFQSSQPFPFVAIDDFLDRDFALEVAASYPPYEASERVGFSFHKLNENRKVQVTDPRLFPAPVTRLAEALGSAEFRASVSSITGIPDLLWDDEYVGGGMHQTASSGLLDVHVDFNLVEPRRWYRRVNLLLFLNENWNERWGGLLELWDRDVRVCHHRFVPKLNRCVIFQTSEHSFHGVTAVKCPQDRDRRSFAVYYYTVEAPQGWAGRSHSTIFKARPDEYLKRNLLMPAARLRSHLDDGVKMAKRTVKRLLGMD